MHCRHSAGDRLASASGSGKLGWCNASGILIKKMPTVKTGGQVKLTTQELPA